MPPCTEASHSVPDPQVHAMCRLFACMPLMPTLRLPPPHLPQIVALKYIAKHGKSEKDIRNLRR